MTLPGSAESPASGADGWGAPRTPSSILAIDANIILSVVLGRRSRPVFERVVEHRTVVTSARAAEEVRNVLTRFPEDRKRAEALLNGIGIVEEGVYAGLLENAAKVLTNAVASRNGSPADAHLLACAWTFDADLWSHDRDFAGTSWVSWSNANLNGSLAPDPA